MTAEAWSAAPPTSDAEQAHCRIILERVLTLARRLHAFPTGIAFANYEGTRVVRLHFPTTIEARRWSEHADAWPVVTAAGDHLAFWAEWTWETCLVQMTADEEMTR